MTAQGWDEEGVHEPQWGIKSPWDDGNALSLRRDGGYSMGRVSKFTKLYM